MSIAHTDRLAGAVKSALRNLPGSLNALAKRAGFSQAYLWQILHELRPATPTVAAKLATALEKLGDESHAAGMKYHRAARAIRRAVGTPRGK